VKQEELEISFARNLLILQILLCVITVISLSFRNKVVDSFIPFDMKAQTLCLMQLSLSGVGYLSFINTFLRLHSYNKGLQFLINGSKKQCFDIGSTTDDFVGFKSKAITAGQSS
jgi:hypothetical protein